MKLKRQLESYKDKDELLRNFQVSVINAFDTQLAVDKQFSRHYEHDEHNEEDYRWNFDEISVHIVVSAMNALGFDINQFERKEQFSLEASEPYFSYYFNKIWEFLKKISPFEFLVAMVAVTQDISQVNPQRNMKLLNEIVREQLDIHDIIFEAFIQKQIFIAMSFNKDMKHAREAIIRAVKNCKFNPVLIDIKEHNNFIVPEIFTEIDKSDMVIADLTQQKTGVYLEAGYAMGQKKPVILSCCEDDFGNKHFDVAQINTIVWKNEDDLEQRLIKRIKSVEHLNKQN